VLRNTSVTSRSSGVRSGDIQDLDIVTVDQ
jgi:hypothetical protein